MKVHVHVCKARDECDYCQRRAEVLRDHEEWTDGELDDMADYAAAAEYGGGHP